MSPDFLRVCENDFFIRMLCNLFGHETDRRVKDNTVDRKINSIGSFKAE
jgi:hypothetical protein